jgi:hypothetical protein
VHGHDAGDFSDDRNTLPLLNMGSYITFSRPEIEAYYAARAPKLRFRPTGESRGPCPIHGGEDDNFSVDSDTGKWFCHSQCQNGGDIIDLEQELTGWDFPRCKAEVFRVIGREDGGVHASNGLGKERRQKSVNNSSAQPVADFQERESQLPATKVREKLANVGFHAVAEFQYGPRLRKVRFEHETKKQDEKDRPKKTFRWEHCIDGIWFSGDGNFPKPLYINNVFQERVEFAVGFEGEAKADVAGELGLAAFSFKDITPDHAAVVLDCDIVLWPDNDESGIEQAQKAAAILAEAGQARSIKVLTPPSELSAAGDIIDAVRALGWDRDHVTQFLNTARHCEPGTSSGGHGPEPLEEGLTQSQLLIQFAAKAAFFHTPDGDAYACLPVGDHRPVKSKSCRRWLTRAFYQAVGKPPGAQAMQDALGVLESKAQFDSPEIQVFTRIALNGDSIYIDLCNEKWAAVEITSKGWKVVHNPPVRFRRSKGMLPLPEPLGGGPIERLRSLI